MALSPEPQIDPLLVKELSKKWEESGITAPFGRPSQKLLEWFVAAKKTFDSCWASLLLYAAWANRIDFATIPFEQIEEALRVGFLVAPGEPYPTLKQDSTQLIFYNLALYDPTKFSARLLSATLWVVLHFLLKESPYAFKNGVTVSSYVKEMAWDKFYPGAQKALTESTQSVLPIRPRNAYLVDSPFAVTAIFSLAKPWMTEKLKERVNFVSQKEFLQLVNPETTPTFFGGKWDEKHGLDERIQQIRHFYETEFQPSMSVCEATLAEEEEEFWGCLPDNKYKRKEKKTPRDKQVKPKKLKKAAVS